MALFCCGQILLDGNDNYDDNDDIATMDIAVLNQYGNCTRMIDYHKTSLLLTDFKKL